MTGCDVCSGDSRPACLPALICQEGLGDGGPEDVGLVSVGAWELVITGHSAFG